jgi:CD109 antigen
MKNRWITLASLFFTLTLLAVSLPACKPVFAVASYMAIIPKVLYSNSTTELSVALLEGNNLASGKVEVVLSQDGHKVAAASSQIEGKGIVALKLPPVASGSYAIQVKGPGFDQKATVKVESSNLVFVETDKPIYKPGQTIHINIISLDSGLKPISQPVGIEVMDAQGLKVFKQDLNTDEYGMAGLDLPLSDEPNLGAWKIIATSGDNKTRLHVRVEQYVLPKYEVKVTLPKDWFLASDRITGTVEGIYSYGRPVNGEIEIIASRYVGTWQEYARFSKPIDGTAEFELPAVGYVAGTPTSGGLGNVSLEFIVREQSTGYEEKSTRLLTIASSPLNLQIVPESVVYKPGLPFNILLLSEDPGGKPVAATIELSATYLDADYKETGKVARTVDSSKGLATVELNPPAGTIALVLEGSTQNAFATRIIQAAYSPSASFIQLEQTSDPLTAVGQIAKFKVHATAASVNFYYEVVAGGRVVFSDYTRNSEISFKVTPQMAGSARLLVYQILPSSEVAADFLPFEVKSEYPNQVSAGFNTGEAKPGDTVTLEIESQGQSKVAVVAVDKSVYILAENRLNLEQVFAELERLYMTPQAELHEVTLYPSVTTKGSMDTFADAGVIVLSNNNLPEGQEYQAPQGGFWDGMIRFFGAQGAAEDAKGGITVPVATLAPTQTQTGGLAEVERIRQYFPETWVWQQLVTDASGHATIELTVPDSITTWMLRAVAISRENGLGIAEAELRAFQDFFIKLDLPYTAVRGEEFEIKAAVYNYLDKTQSVVVTLDPAGWFELLDQSQKTLEIAPGEVGSAAFKIRITGLGFNDIKVTARTGSAADAVIQPLLIQPEGIPREFVENLVLYEGISRTLDTGIAPDAVADSGRVYLTLTGSYLAQTLEGLEGLIQMPFGCGEQNMINFAPNVYIASYLEQSGQLKPEILAKLELMTVTGYQRELTYRRSDGSFSAFGNQDPIGSLWLTAFVMKSFSEAHDIIYIDPAVLEDAQQWITGQQKADGSFEAVGFVHHQEMLGGLQGKDALTAYVAMALIEAGETSASAKAVAYLESRLSEMDDAYTLAITSYVLELAGSSGRNAAYAALKALAVEDESGLHWGETTVPGPMPEPQPFMRMPPADNRSAVIETTAYATLALSRRGDNLNAGKAAKWLVSQRNAYGGFGSTQDTVVGLQALTDYAGGLNVDVDLTIAVKSAGVDRQIRINAQNYDVLQVIELPVDELVTISAAGKGEVISQLVKRFNIAGSDEIEPVIGLDVEYDASEVEVNDLVNVNVSLKFNPPEIVESGMLVVDISIPTGFEADIASIEAMLGTQPLFKRYDIAGRKVILYIDNLKAGASLDFSFKVRAVFPVKAQGVTSQAYSYYQPDFRGESLSQDMTVR